MRDLKFKIFWLILAFCVFYILSVFKAHSQDASPWQLLDYYTDRPDYNFSNAWAQAGDQATFTFPDGNLHAHYPAFLVSTQAQAMDLSNATIQCQFTLETASGTVFRYGGQGSWWNKGTAPARARLFLSASYGYDNETPQPTDFWFNDVVWADIETNVETVVLSATLDHSGDWSDAKGGTLTEPFWSCVHGVRQIGLAFGGGSFFDTGIAVMSGNCVFHLNFFSVTPRFYLNIEGDKISVVGGFVNTAYTVERSEDLVSWICYGEIAGGTSNTLTAVSGFYRARAQ